MLLSSCSQATVQATPTNVPTGVLTPYHTVTSTPTSPVSTVEVAIPVTPAPTATPFLHTITNDDTMLGIAYQYGITLEELQAANPGVDPHYLSVGKQLIIPINGEIPEIIPTPTAMPVHYEQPNCFRSGDEGIWCIVAVRNDMELSVENISVWIGLFTRQGEIIANQVTYAPLNILRPGSTIPVMAFFAPPIPSEYVARSELLSGLAVAADDGRYLDIQVKIKNIEISPDGTEVRVSGGLILDDSTSIPSQMWVLGVAYDLEGKIIGERKWESKGEKEFSFSVYSLGAMIDHVEVLVEVRP